jgi:hypothetical protein
MATYTLRKLINSEFVIPAEAGNPENYMIFLDSGSQAFSPWPE